MSIKQRLYYNIGIFIYKIPNNTLPVALRNRIEIVGSDSERQKRDRQEISYRNSGKLGVREACSKSSHLSEELKEYILTAIP